MGIIDKLKDFMALATKDAVRSTAEQKKAYAEVLSEADARRALMLKRATQDKLLPQLANYYGKWVAISKDEKVVESAAKRSELLRKLKEKGLAHLLLRFIDNPALSLAHRR